MARMLAGAQQNSGMHPTRDTQALIFSKVANGRVVPGVRLLVFLQRQNDMGRVKKTIALVTMLVFMLGGAVGGGSFFVRLAGSPFALTNASDYALAFFLFCLLMLSGFIGMCLGTFMFMLVLKPFASKAQMHETFIADPNCRYPRTMQLLGNLLDVIY